MDRTIKSYEGVKDFYLDRIRFAMKGNFRQREEMLQMICRTAFMDSMLTSDEFVAVLHSVDEAHKKSMEANFNEGWN